MWLERYLNRPILENVGFDEPEEFIYDLTYACGTQPVAPGCAIPLMSMNSGERWLLPSGMHTLCVGTTGSGKTRRLLAPAILNAIQTGCDSMLVLDIKGELRAMTESVAKKSGYRVYAVDLKDMSRSCRFNPLQLANVAYERGDYDAAMQELTKVASVLFPPPPPGSKTDYFWSRSASGTFVAMGMFAFLLKGSHVCIPDISILANEIQTDDDAYLHKVTDRMKKKYGSDCAALRQLKVVTDSGTVQRGNLLANFHTTLGEYLLDPTMEDLLAGHDIDFDDIESQPTVIYFCMNDASSSAYGLAKMIVSQLYTVLCQTADRRPTRRLNRSWHFFLDEVANGAPIADFEKMLSVARSRSINIHIVLQSLTQLEAIYGEASAETIRSQFSVTCVMHTTSSQSWKLVSSQCGVNRLGQPLVEPYMLARLNVGQCLVLRKGHRPFMTHLEDVSQHPCYAGE